ncbi:hypothetical protein [Paraburkholderia tropica]|uniref:hypothetical protein n=1 Tax=Paraburkholderia tropica TaxID=92647 RepID=UPI002AB6622F|nr:hypothetical protein [Paraburkholderia tropica]
MKDAGMKIIGGVPIRGLRVEHFLDPQTGVPECHYLLSGALVAKVRLKGNLAEQMSGLALIEKDLSCAKGWAQKAQNLGARCRGNQPDDAVFIRVVDEELSDEAKAFFVASLTFYGKAFAEGLGRRAQLQRDWLSSEFREIHDYFINFRHNFAAHSGKAKLENASTHLLLIPVENERVLLQPASTRLQPSFAKTGQHENDFVKLLDHAISVVQGRHYAAGKRLMAVVNEKPIAFWQIAAQGNIAVDLDDVTKSMRGRRRK